MSLLALQDGEPDILPSYLDSFTESVKAINIRPYKKNELLDSDDEKISQIIFDYRNFLANTNGLIIDYIGDRGDSFLGIRLVYHLRLEEALKAFPIFVVGNKRFGTFLLELAKAGFNEYVLLFQTKGIFYYDSQVQSGSLQTLILTNVRADSLVNYSKKAFLSKIIVREPDKTGRHAIANEWGIYRIIEIMNTLEQATKTDIENLSTLDKSKTSSLYFKYIKSIYNVSKPVKVDGCSPFHSSKLKILVIDDNVHKGWKECLQIIFKKTILEKEIELDIQDCYSKWGDRIKNSLNKDLYDLIFLDYRFENDNKNGKEILSIIKGRNEQRGIYESINPVVPVIMFTASNKAWNMDALYEAGADGYYIKEHPETASNPQFSKENFENLHKTIKICLDKGALLRPYWRKIQEIKAKIRRVVPLQNDLVVERIEERLDMFLGLLKKSFEQTEFDKNTFFYSDIELAFLTLWSALNDIQHAYYFKHNNFVPFYNNHSLITGHPQFNSRQSRKVLSFLNNWQFQGSSEYLIKYEPERDSMSDFKHTENGRFYKMATYTRFFYDRSKNEFSISPEYRRVDSNDPNKHYSGHLYLQIGFLLYCVNKFQQNTISSQTELFMQCFVVGLCALASYLYPPRKNKPFGKVSNTALNFSSVTVVAA